MKREFDLEYLAVDIQEVLNVLGCFEEFCADEGESTNCNTTEEQINAAFLFINRLQRRRCLLHAVETILMEDLNQLDEYIKANVIGSGVS